MDTNTESMEISEIPYSEGWYNVLRQRLGEGICRRLGIYAVPSGSLLSVVIPVYNERHTLMDLVNRVRAVPVRKEIILVDDGSKDGTRDLLKEVEQSPPNDEYNTIRVFFHD
ncbi:MAG: glycosyltransferase, partial [Planctomycetaceae bacterium]|nr:glycosyltransferase [Planctomycetaceae bacterium]